MSTKTNHNSQAEISVVVPTYFRQEDLSRCLDSLEQLNPTPSEVIVVARDTDGVSQNLVRSRSKKTGFPLRLAIVSRPGQVAALECGAQAARQAVVAFTDDDACPRPDWVGRIMSHFDRDSKIVAVGGRDWVHELGTTLDGSRNDVGRLTWYGKMIGNHHLGVGPPREVDSLKGANMAFRREPLLEVGYDHRLRGQGAQVANELTVCLPLRKGGWKIIYDPLVAVDHYPSVRHDADKRYVFQYGANVDATHNETLPILDHLSASRRFAFLAWAFLVGTRRSWGLLQAIRFGLGSGRQTSTRLWAGWNGRKQAMKTRRSQPKSSATKLFAK